MYARERTTPYLALVFAGPDSTQTMLSGTDASVKVLGTREDGTVTIEIEMTPFDDALSVDDVPERDARATALSAVETAFDMLGEVKEVAS